MPKGKTETEEEESQKRNKKDSETNKISSTDGEIRPQHTAYLRGNGDEI